MSYRDHGLQVTADKVTLAVMAHYLNACPYIQLNEALLYRKRVTKYAAVARRNVDVSLCGFQPARRKHAPFHFEHRPHSRRRDL